MTAIQVKKILSVKLNQFLVNQFFRYQLLEHKEWKILWKL